jgi:hypothetical protein
MYKEWSGKSMAEVELLGKKAVVLEVFVCFWFVVLVSSVGLSLSNLVFFTCDCLLDCHAY